MFVNGKEQLLLKLQQLFKEREDAISSGRVRVCLTASMISFLNKCFHDSEYYSDSQKDYVAFLKECISTVHSLKIVPGPTFKFNCVVDISHFQCLQVLEISKLAVGYVSGLQTLRAKIKYLKTSRSIEKINDVLVLCGSDQSTEFAWSQLEQVDFSYNSINRLDSSLRLLTSLKSLDLSHNELAMEEENWLYLPEVTWLNIGHNQITKVPSFPENCCSKITTLLLTNNDLNILEGLEVLPNLEALDVSSNCISSFYSLIPLAGLQRLVLLNCSDNPISYHENYRSTVISCLSPSPRNVPIVFDGQQLRVQELYILGNSLEVDLSSYIPSRPYTTPTPTDMARSLDPEVVLQESSEPTLSRTPDEKRKGRKSAVRQPSIHSAGEEQVRTKNSDPSDNTSLEATEELRKLEKFKQDAGEDYLVVRNQEVKEKTEQSIAVDLSECSSSSYSAQPEISTEENCLVESPPPNKPAVQTVQEDIESDRLFLVSARSPSKMEGDDLSSEDLFVTVKEDVIKEHDINLTVMCSLDLNSLLDVEVIPSSENFTVKLKFDYLAKDKKFREYVIADEVTCQRFVALVEHFVKQPVKPETTSKKQCKCLKCSACYEVDGEVIVCSYCNSSMVVEVAQDSPVKNASPQNKSDYLRTETFANGPDLIPRAVSNSIPPDVCGGSFGKDHENNSSDEYGALVSSIKLKSKDYEDNFINVEDPPINYPAIPPRRTEQSEAMSISLERSSPGAFKSFYQRFRRTSSTSSPIQSSASPLSEPESRSSTPGKSSGIHFSMDSCTHCDHRLKLYFDTKLFKGGDEEEFCCMIKCPLVSYGFKQGTPSLLVISNIAVYICKITAFESSQPKEWLSLKDSYVLSDLRHLEYGLASQSFRMEFAQTSGCHTFLVGDAQRCENFLQTLRGIVKKACRKKNKQSVSISKANPQTLANISIQVFGVKDESLIAKGQRFYQQAVNFTHPPLVKDRKNWFRSLSQSMLGAEFIDWLLSRKEASSYREAVQIGQLLLDAGVIQCFDKDCSFLEKDQYYYFNLSEGEHKSGCDEPQYTAIECSEVDTTIKQYILGKWSQSFNRKDTENILPVSIICSNTHIALAEANHQWPLPRFHHPPASLSGPQFVFLTKQKITNITDVELFAEHPCEIAVQFHDEDMPGDVREDRWLLIFWTEYSLESFLDGVKEVWEEKFGVELPFNVIEKNEENFRLV